MDNTKILVDLEAPPVDQETMVPSFVPLFRSGTVFTPSQNTSFQVSSIPNLVSASSGRESEVQIDESSLTSGLIPSSLTHCWLYLIMWIRQVSLGASMRLVYQLFSSLLKVKRRNVEWNF